MTLTEVLALATDLGFSHAGPLNVQSLKFLPEVRDMCAADRCHNYGKCWTCPPHCGTLEEMSQRAAGYTSGILVQSTAQMEDDFDVECMLETEHLQKRLFSLLVSKLSQSGVDFLPLATGACTICNPCACPDEPCRFPQQAIPSMEAYGLVVSQVCQDSGLPYYYGPRTMTYTSCVLLRL